MSSPIQAETALPTGLPALHRALRSISASDTQPSLERGRVALLSPGDKSDDLDRRLLEAILRHDGYRVSAELDGADVIAITVGRDLDASELRGMVGRLRARGRSAPIVCGGEGITAGYVDHDLRDVGGAAGVFHFGGPLEALRIIERTCGPVPGRRTEGTTARAYRHVTHDEQRTRREQAFNSYARSDVVRSDRIPDPPFWGSRVAGPETIDLSTIFKRIDRRWLFEHRWRYQRPHLTETQHHALIERTVEPRFYELCERVVAERLVEPSVVYGYFPCQSDRNELVIYDPEVRLPATRIRLPRQLEGTRLCIADYFRPARVLERDVVALVAVTMGERAEATKAALWGAGDVDEYFHFHGLAQAASETVLHHWHRRIQRELGFGPRDDDDDLPGHLSGHCFLLDHSAGPRASARAELFELLRPDRIGIRLVASSGLRPAHALAGIVVHHPNARDFTV